MTIFHLIVLLTLISLIITIFCITSIFHSYIYLTFAKFHNYLSRYVIIKLLIHKLGYKILNRTLLIWNLLHNKIKCNFINVYELKMKYQNKFKWVIVIWVIVICVTLLQFHKLTLCYPPQSFRSENKVLREALERLNQLVATLKKNNNAVSTERSTQATQPNQGSANQGSENQGSENQGSANQGEEQNLANQQPTTTQQPSLKQFVDLTQEPTTQSPTLGDPSLRNKILPESPSESTLRSTTYKESLYQTQDRHSVQNIPTEQTQNISTIHLFNSWEQRDIIMWNFLVQVKNEYDRSWRNLHIVGEKIQYFGDFRTDQWYFTINLTSNNK